MVNQICISLQHCPSLLNPGIWVTSVVGFSDFIVLGVGKLNLYQIRVKWGQVESLYFMRLVAIQDGACLCPEAVRGEVAGLVFHTPESHDQGCGVMCSPRPRLEEGNINSPFPLK